MFRILFKFQYRRVGDVGEDVNKTRLTEHVWIEIEARRWVHGAR